MAIHQEIVLSAPPDRVYAVLTTSAQFSKATGGAPAEIANTEGGAFSQFGGMIHGRHIELVPGTRVVQAWRAKPWEPGAYSLVRFTLAPEGNGTKVTLDHTGFPAEQEAHLAAGWSSNYWEPFKAFFTAP